MATGLASPLLILLLIFYAPTSLSTPFVLLHGINDQCSHHGVAKVAKNLRIWSGVKGYCIEIGNGIMDSWFMPLPKQIDIVCEKVKEMPQLRNGYNIVGLSQGNLIARGLIEFCGGGPPVKNYISLAGPHAGIASVPLCGSGIICQIANDLIKLEIYSNYVQDHLAPSGYVKIPYNIPKYLKGCKFLPILNNEIPGNRISIHKERFSSLQKLVLIMFEQETVLIPKETSWFGYYADGTFNTTLAANQTTLYIEDWIGLKTLNEYGRVEFISVQGSHLKISPTDMKKYIVPYLKEDDNQQKSLNHKFSAFTL